MGGSTDSLEFVFKVGQALADALGILACVQKVIHAGAIALVVIVRSLIQTSLSVLQGKSPKPIVTEEVS